VSDDPLVIYRRWEDVTLDLLQRTQKFPRTARFTFSERVDNLALDVLEQLLTARYRKGRERQQALEEIDLRLTRLRALLRLCHAQRYLDNKGYAFVAAQLDEVGRMVGGWRKASLKI
jgi:hypothetical protein